MSEFGETRELFPKTVSPQALMGIASPLWGLFAGAAATGMAWWWMTRWTSPQNLEALFGAVAARNEATAEPVAALVEPELPAAVVGGESAPMSPVLATVVEAEAAIAKPAQTAVQTALEAAPKPAPEPAVNAAPQPNPVKEAAPEPKAAPDASPKPEPAKEAAPQKPSLDAAPKPEPVKDAAPESKSAPKAAPAPKPEVKAEPSPKPPAAAELRSVAPKTRPAAQPKLD